MLLSIKNKKSGFTIVELLVVIVVIGVLAAITVVAYNGIAGRAKESSLISDMSNARKVLEMYKIEYSYYPDYNDCSIPESSTTICLKTSQNNSIDYQSEGETYTMYGSIINYPNFFRATNEVAAEKFTGWRQISPGFQHTCGIYYNGKAYCWGYNQYGQLGDGSNSDKKLPAAVSAGAIGNKTIRYITTNYSHTCAIASDNKAYCWGLGTAGQLGNGANLNKNVPVAVSAGAIGSQVIKSIKTGILHTCAIAFDNKTYCWGSTGAAGLLGNGSGATNYIKNTPAAVSAGAIGSQTIKSIAVGDYHTCVIAVDNKAYCWGFNREGQLGDGTSDQYKDVPIAVSTGEIGSQTIKSVTAGDSHTCAIAFDNKAYCWGHGYYGQLGNGANLNKNMPVAVSAGAIGSQTIKSIVAGGYHTCAIASNNKAYCWGLGANGQLGGGSYVYSQNKPVAVSDGEVGNQAIIYINSNYHHTCAIAFDNKAYCWGQNDKSQLGNGLTSTSYSPILVKNP